MRLSQFRQEVDDFRLAPVHGSDEFSAHDSFAIDDVGLWVFEGAIEIAALVIGVADGEEIDFVAGQEAVVGVAVDVHAHTYDGEAFGSHPPLEVDQGRHLLDAGGAPGRPEIQDQNLALKVVKVNFAIGVLHGEFGGGSANVRRAGAAVTTGEQDRDYEKDGQASHKAIITNSADDGV